MRKIVNDLLQFIRSHSLAHWLTILVFCALTTYVNFTWGVEKGFRRMESGDEFTGFFVMYLLHFGTAYLIYSFFKRDFTIWAKPGFLLLLLLACLIFSLRACADWHQGIIRSISDDGNYLANNYLYGDLFRLSYLLIPVTLIWILIDRNQAPYGFSVEHHHWRIYFTLLLCMVPLIIGASFLSDFLDYYPRAKKLDRFDFPAYKYWLFELFYGMDFISIEYFFRGFLVMAFARYVGFYAVLPMSCFYLSIHFGKPLGEAVSSFFGGTILGVIAYHSKSIFGGIMVHMGIAWLMELGAYIGNFIRHH